MRPLFIQRVVVGVLGGTEAVVAQIRLQVLHVTIGRIEGCRGVSQPVQRSRAQVVDFSAGSA